MKIPTVPWMPPEETEFLTEKLKESFCYLEYGAGGSTVLAAKIGVKCIYSVESNNKFLSEIKKIVNFTPIYVYIGPTKGLGYPKDETKRDNWPEYTKKPWEIMVCAPDLILIDGRFRTSCLLYSLSKAEPGTTILMDDFRKRHHYHVVEPDYLVGRMGVFIVKNQELPENTYWFDPR